jgi:hypothetical protein
MTLTTINNKTALREHETSVFHFNVLQVLSKLLHIKMCLSALRHSVYEMYHILHK